MKGFAFANTGDRLKFSDVIQFGGLQLVPTQGQTFYGCANFTGASISDVLDTTGVTSMARMYQGCTSYNGPVDFNTSSVTNMSQMFYQATNFNQPVNFDTSSVTNMQQMFHLATSFNKPLNLNTSFVTNMSYMLAFATSFDQDISAWVIDQVSNFFSFMAGTTLSTVNYDTLLIAWAAQAPLNPSATSIHFGNSKYTSTDSSVVSARNTLTTHFTSFTDGGAA